jgi:tricorn protease
MNAEPIRLTILLLSSVLLLGLTQAGTEGYYRFPTLQAETLVFTAEGDLWTAPVAGGTARRLTSHAGLESGPAISGDGRWLVFIGQMDGADEVYVMPLAAGNCRSLAADAQRLYFIESDPAPNTRPVLRTLSISNQSPEPETFADNVRAFALAGGADKLAYITEDNAIFIVDRGPCS